MPNVTVMATRYKVGNHFVVQPFAGDNHLTEWVIFDPRSVDNPMKYESFHFAGRDSGWGIPFPTAESAIEYARGLIEQEG